MRLSPKCVFCFLNTDIQIGTLFWGKYQVLYCPTQIKNLKILNEADFEKNFPPLLFVGQGQGKARKKGRVQKSVVETYDRMTKRPPVCGPSPGASRPCDGHQPLNALWWKPSKERTAKSKERQEVEAGSRSSKNKKTTNEPSPPPRRVHPTALLRRALLSEVGEGGAQSSQSPNTNCCLEPTKCCQNKRLLCSSEASWQRKERHLMRHLSSQTSLSPNSWAKDIQGRGAQTLVFPY